MNEVMNKFMKYALKLFPEYPSVASEWGNDILHLFNEENESYEPSQSLKAFLYILNNISDDYELGIDNVEDWIYTYSDRIREFVVPHLLSNDIEHSHEEDKNKETVKELLNQSYIESGTALLFHKLRDTISKNEFEQHSLFPTARIDEKSLKATAQLRSEQSTLQMLSSEALEQWKSLTAHAITSMDDLTADLFDIISILWLRQATHKDEMIHFHSDDALNLRQVQGRKEIEGYQLNYRKKERDDIMKRLAALTSIWIRIEQDSLKFVDAESNEVEELEKVQFNPLFILDSITVAYRGNEPIGIYECKVRPGELLANFLYGSKRSSGLLALRTLQYNPTKQKYHKRLARYLSWQWRIRQKGADYYRPYTIGGEKGLLNVMGIQDNPRYGSRVKDQFESILETLEEDGIIKEWRYEGFNENMVDAERSWYSDHWLSSKVQILPPTDYIQQSKLGGNETVERSDEFDYTSLLKSITSTKEEKDLSIVSPKGVEVTPETIKAVRLERGLTLKQVADILSLSHATLSRYENGVNPPSKKNYQKLKHWINNM